MNLFENAFVIYAIGAVLITFFGLVFLTRRNVPSLAALVVAVLLTLVMIIVERVVVTDGELIESTATELMLALEDNDVQGVLKFVDPAASVMRTEIETMMPLVKVEDTSSSLVKVEVEASQSPATATSKFQMKVDCVLSRDGFRIFYLQPVELDWIKRDDQWYVTGYVPYYDGRPISAVDSLRGKRPVGR